MFCLNGLRDSEKAFATEILLLARIISEVAMGRKCFVCTDREVLEMFMRLRYCCLRE